MNTQEQSLWERPLGKKPILIHRLQPLMSHLPLCKTNTLLTMTRVNCPCTDTQALLVLQQREDVWLPPALSPYKHALLHLSYYSTDGTLASTHTHSTQHSVVTPHMSQIRNKTTVAQDSQALRVSLIQTDLFKIGLLCLAEGTKYSSVVPLTPSCCTGSDSAHTLQMWRISYDNVSCLCANLLWHPKVLKFFFFIKFFKYFDAKNVWPSNMMILIWCDAFSKNSKSYYIGSCISTVKKYEVLYYKDNNRFQT